MMLIYEVYWIKDVQKWIQKILSEEAKLHLEAKVGMSLRVITMNYLPLMNLIKWD